MSQSILIVAVTLWTAGNMYVWSLKQSELVLFAESLGSGALAMLALYAYVTRRER